MHAELIVDIRVKDTVVQACCINSIRIVLLPPAVNPLPSTVDPMKHLTLFVILCVYAFGINAQCPPNLDFEAGTLDHWQPLAGTATSNEGKNLINLSNSDPVTGRHEIISASTPVQKDPYGNFPTLCPYGGKFSVKLGNENVGAEAEGISYTFSIPSNIDTFTFTYFYAVVFQDPNHDAFDQPRFFVTAFDVETGDVINCASYDYIATASLPGFTVSKANPEVLFKNWSPVSLQFFGLNGRDVRLEFRTADCTLGGHFGYAYLDVGTACSNILATAPYCAETNSLILNAPYGFKDYTWYSQDYSTIVGTGQSITFSPAPATEGSYFVDMVPYPGFGCRDTASATVKPLPVPPTPLVDSIFFCQFQSPEPLTATALPDHDLLWYASSAGGLPYETSPVLSTILNDTIEYYVSQKKLFGCESFRVKQSVVIRPTPAAFFGVNNAVQCENGNDFSFTNSSDNLSHPKFLWDFGDGTIDSSFAATVQHSYKNYGEFYVKLTVANQPACTNEMVSMVRVMPKPVAAFDAPPVICDQEEGVTLTDKSYVPSGLGMINLWNWEVDGISYSTQLLPDINVVHGGSLPITLTVTTAEGCASDTLRRSLPVRHQPVASFSYANKLCENELIQFTDLAHIPSGLNDEYIEKWTWTFDASGTSSSQRPARYFDAGSHQARLAVTSNFGCQSKWEEKDFVVHPKPAISLSMNDSCVYKDIIYSALDLRNDVVHWYWDFGNGLKKGESIISKKFSREGDQSFLLITETSNGCRDTINRAFTIYDNDSYAGSDTIVAKDQPVFLDARGGKDVTYRWSPSTGLSNPNIERPVAIFNSDITYTLYSITNKGCQHTSNILIKRYAGAEIYIPNAFTPNGDGKNDVLKVIPIGFKSFHSMAVYNRYGQQVFLTGDWKKGWDGTIAGVKQDAGNYVVATKMTDYTGKVLIRKANVMLLR